MLTLSKVTKKFGELVAVNDLGFTVEKGQIFGIAGPNGAGKSTVYNLITGFYPYQGRVMFDGRDISGLPPHRIARIGIARTFQVPRSFPSMTVEENVAVGGRFGHSGRFDPSFVDDIIRFVDLEAQRRWPAGRLNLLDQKELMMAAALATRPRLLMLDEPMAGSNTAEIRKLMDLIRSINQDLGITIIIIEHFMKVLTELTEKLLIIESGTAIAFGDPEAVTSDPRVCEVYLGKTYAESH
ncbi:MAG: ABC transporter ATP-binding protein [Desulfosarcina sp.]|nr:ABC transporter ATP-binding protein [Desulfobacterales bacterium]